MQRHTSAPPQQRLPRAPWRKRAARGAAVGLLIGAPVLSAQDWENYTYRLTQSTAEYQLWTTPPSERVFKDRPVPATTGSGVKVYAARNEFEPFQVVVKPTASGDVSINIGDFGAGIGVEIYQVRYVEIAVPSDHLGRTGPYPDPLWPVQKGASVAVTAGENTALWFSVSVPTSVTSGDYTASVDIAGVSVPVTLHVFDFSIPAALHVRSEMNLLYGSILNNYSVPVTGSEYWRYVDATKQYMIDHRLTPKSVLWPGGLTANGASPFIDYNCNTHALSDSWGIWGFEDPAERYLGGTGLMGGQFTESFNGGTGFPSFMAATFQTNDPSADPRPNVFCGLTRSSSDWLQNPTSAFNQAWFAYITAIQTYLTSLGYLDEAYYYFANEPQDQADYDAVAWYSRYLKQAAPNLKLMVSEEPKPEIVDHAWYVSDAQINTWLAVLNSYDPTVSHDRKTGHGEATWIYFLRATRPPYFNPITLDHPGIESRLTGWFLWKHRIEGIAHYSMNDWSQNPWTDPARNGHNGETFLLYPPAVDNTPIPYGSNGHRLVPSIRLELIRDSLEDFEYLYVLNGAAMPEVGVPNAADTQADQVIGGVVSYARNGEFVYNLRRLVGRKNGGEITVIPDIDPPIEHPRSEGAPGNYYINFQDPDGLPATTFTEDTYGTGYIYKYFTYLGRNYLQVGTEEYAADAGFGWLDDTTHFLTGRFPGGGVTDERKITCVYDEWAEHPGVFEFDLPNGTYRVWASVGRPLSAYAHNRVVIEGVSFIDDEPSTSNLVRSKRVTVDDNKLTVDVGIWGEYTLLDYLDIQAVAPDEIFSDGFES